LKIGKGKSYSIKDYKSREVNLLPSDFNRGARIKTGIIVLIALAIMAVGAFGYYEFTVIQRTAELEDLTQQRIVDIAKNQKIIQKQQVIESIDQRIVIKEALLDYIFMINRPIDEIIDVFEKSLNGELYLTSITVNSTESLNIAASSLSHEAVSFTINQLKLMTTEDGEKYFDEVFTNGIVRNVDEAGNVTYLFQLECKFGGGVLDEIK
jgi:hypothetical protein